MDISEIIKQVRETKGIKQVDIAKAIGVERGNYFRLEKRGEKLTIEQLQNIATALEVSIAQLLGLAGLSEEGQEEFQALENRTNAIMEVRQSEQMALKDLQAQVSEMFMEYRSQLAQKNEIGHYLYNEIEGDDLVKVPLKGFKVSDNAALEQLCYDGKYERLFSPDEPETSRLNELLFEDVAYRQHVINFMKLGLIREKGVFAAYNKFRSSSKPV